MTLPDPVQFGAKTLASLGAIELTPEIRDIATAPRRLLAELRAHLRARAARGDPERGLAVLDKIDAAFAGKGE